MCFVNKLFAIITAYNSRLVISAAKIRGSRIQHNPTAVKMECKSKNITIERKFVSNIASNLWKSEPAIVKNTYKEIENDAKILYNMIQQENDFVTSAISGENIFPPSPPLLS
ncbi:21228_t:CDS:2 [Rhizophagus irregularis]|nr:21228_t:CDS:2 [Rhizophagus irregularis]